MRFRNKDFALILLTIPTVLIATSTQPTIVSAEEDEAIDNSLIVKENENSLTDTISLSEELNTSNIIVTINEANGNYTLLGEYIPNTSLVITISSDNEFEVVTDEKGNFEIELGSIKIDNTTLQIEVEDESLVYKGIIGVSSEYQSDSERILSETAEEPEEVEVEESTTDEDNSNNLDENKEDSTISKESATKSRNFTPFSAKTISNVDGTKYHYVQPGETLYSIARLHGATTNELKEWNDIEKVSNIKPGDIFSVNGHNIYNEINSETITFDTPTSFLNYIVPIAQEVAEEYGIYTSVMVAQLINESGWGKSPLAVSGNNLGGVKGQHNGNSIVTLTWEEINGEEVWVQDEFRLYPSYKESIIDNAKKIRNGSDFDSNYYHGAWGENTASHLDATEWLTGRYATDSAYGTKLNDIIDRYDLTQYDTHIPITNPITSQKSLNTTAIIGSESYSIYSQPEGTASYEVIDNTSNYSGTTVQVKGEKVNNLGTWWLVYNGNDKLGWVKKDALALHPVLSTEYVDYQAEVVNSWSINTQPWGIDDFEEVTTGASYLGDIVNVTQEKVTPRSTYALIAVNGTEIGWIDKGALNPVDSVISTTNTNYVALIEQSWSINTQPYGTAGSEFIMDASSYVNKTVDVVQEKVTQRNTYALLEYNGEELGWFDTKGLQKQHVLSTQDTNYIARVEKSWSINTLPWGVNGFEFIEDSSAYLGENVMVVQEKETPRSTYGLLEYNGEELGWFDTDGLTKQEVLSTENLSYQAEVVKSWSINTHPWGTNGFEEVSTGASYLGDIVNITQEKVTPRSTYALIVVNDEEIGWIDKGALDLNPILSTTNYVAKIEKSWSINTQPWGTTGFEFIENASNYVGKNVEVIQEKTTPRSTYALLKYNGEELGWFDKKGFDQQRVLSSRDTNYEAKVEKSWSINTLPWGVNGYELIEDASAYVGEDVTVIQEKETPRSTYGLLEYNGNELGWFDIDGLEIQEVLSTNDVNYTATVSNSWSINTLPWGVNGYEFIENASPYLNETVTVTQEKETPRGIYALINIDNRELGWIDKGALEVNQEVLNTRDTNYAAEVTEAWSINTKPWGIDGFEEVTTGGPYLGKTVEVIQEKETPRSTYALITFNGEELGWIDADALEAQRVLSSRNTSYMTRVENSWSINTQPWGVEGYEFIRDASSYVGKAVEVVQEKRTPRSTYALIKHNGLEIGWFDTKGLEKQRVLSTKNVNYVARVEKSWTINTQPWGTEGSKFIEDASAYVGENVTVTQEKETPRSTYVLLTLNGVELGWFDIDGLRIAPVVYVDPGHGGSDPGAQSGGVKEKDLNLSLSLKVRDILEDMDYTVVMSRETDVFPSLSDRAQEANKLGADILVSIHHNAWNGKANGISSFYYNERGNTNNPKANDGNRIKDSQELAKEIQDELIKETGANNRGVKKANFHVLRETEMPSVLVEGGFIDNTIERAKLVLDSYQQKLANAISTGINKFFSLWK